ncbi:MAG: serine hydrolase [Sphingomonadaceae bacterium]
MLAPFRFPHLRVAALFCLSALCASAVQAAPKPADPAVLARQLDTFIAKGMQDWQIPGLSIVVVTAQGVVYEKGFGVRAAGQPDKVDPHTLFGMASTAKALTSLALAMLVDEGKLQWDDPVIRHLPQLRLPNDYLTSHVTVRDLLRHTSGVAEADLLWSREDFSTAEILARLDRVPATTSLRSDFVYNNVMYQVAGNIVAAASGMSWDSFIRSRILQPLGMRESYTTTAAMRAVPQANVSRPHGLIDGKLQLMEDSSADAVPAAGGAWSNAHDAGKWLSFLLAGGKVGTQRLVSEASFKELLTPQVAVNRAQWLYPTTALTHSRFTAYGLGWFLQDYRGQFAAMHTGSLNGRTAIIGLLPDAQVAVYAFGNLDHAEFRHALLWQVLDLYSGAPARDWNGEALKLYGEIEHTALAKQAAEVAHRIPDTRPSHPLASYAGTFRHPAWGELSVVLDGDTLKLAMGSAPDMTSALTHWHYDSFRARLNSGLGGWDTFTFGTGSDGSIDSITGLDSTFVRVPAPAAH